MDDGTSPVVESPRHPYTVLEPEEAPEAVSERSTSIDGSEGVKFSMQEMEFYMTLLQRDRCVVVGACAARHNGRQRMHTHARGAEQPTQGADGAVLCRWRAPRPRLGVPLRRSAHLRLSNVPLYLPHRLRGCARIQGAVHPRCAASVVRRQFCVDRARPARHAGTSSRRKWSA